MSASVSCGAGHGAPVPLPYGAMTLLDYTTEGALSPRLVCPTLESAVEHLAGALATAGLVRDAERLARDVLRREAESGSALAEGLALPHARSEAAVRVRLAVATLASPVPARGGEGEPRRVDVVVLLTAPPSDLRGMLRVLARLAREVRGGDLLARLRRAETPAEVAAALAAVRVDQT